jgi:hypothetical protein
VDAIRTLKTLHVTRHGRAHATQVRWDESYSLQRISG